MIERLLGRLLQGRHAGETKLIWNHPSVADVPASIHLSSPAFPADGMLPLRYAGPGVGDNQSPALHWSNLPEETVELVVIMEDPDVPVPNPALHLVASGISPSLGKLNEGALNHSGDSVVLGKGSLGKVGYSGPRALRAHGPHRYVFQIFAVNTALQLREKFSRQTLLETWSGRVIARGRLDGFFERR